MASPLSVSHALRESDDGWHESLAAGAVLVSVNQRLSRHHDERFHTSMLSAGSPWWETPRILPWQSWLISLHDEALAKGCSDRLRVPVLAQQRHWRRCIDSDSSGLLLLDPDATAVLAQQACATASQWHCANHPDDYLSADQWAFERWAAHYRRYQSTHSLIDEASVADHMAELIAEDPGCVNLPETVLLAGFIAFSPQQEAFLSVLQSSGVELQSDGSEDASRIFSLYDSKPALESTTIRVEQHADDDAELISVAKQLRSLVAVDTSLRLAVVVSDLQQRRSQVTRAFDSVFFPGLSPDNIAAIERPYDFSLGQPLSLWPVVATGMLILKLPLQALRGPEVSDLLLSPHVAGTEATRRARERIDLRLRDKRISRVDRQGLVEQLDASDELRVACIEWMSTLELGGAGLGEWAVRFGGWLKQLGWPGKSCTSDEYQAIQAWYSCLDDVQSLDDGELVSGSDALALVLRLSRERVFQPETPARPIQIMGRLESHGMSFDRLWVTGLDADQWPAGSSPSPFLSIERQKAAGVPDSSPGLRLAQARREFALWKRSAPWLNLSRAMTRDGNALSSAAVLHEAGLEVSLKSSEENPAPLSLKTPAAVVLETISLEHVVDDHGPVVAEGSSVRGGSRLFENQALCPFKAFALHRLQIRPMEEAGIGMDARQRGTFVHAALEAFWREIRTHEALMALEPDALDAAIGTAVASALDEEEVDVPASLEPLELVRVQRLLSEWIDQCEKPRTPFEAVGFEESMTFEHGSVQMNVTLDRIDVVNGVKVVIDYKTGVSNSVNSWADERIVNPQLPLYVLTDEHIEAASFAQVARNQCGFVGVASDGDLLPRVRTSIGEIEDWHSWRGHWRTALDAIAIEVRDGLASVTPMKGACAYCDLKPLCRVEQVSTASEPTELETSQTPTYPGSRGERS